MLNVEKLEAIREHFIKKLGSTERRWRVKRSEMVGTFRYKMIEALIEAKEPLNAYQLSYVFSKGLETIRNHLRVLEYSKILCTKLENLFEDDDRRSAKYYTVCPICPMKEECKKPLEFWVKSGLMEKEPLPSEKFLEK